MTGVFVSLLMMTGCSDKDGNPEQAKQEERNVENDNLQEEVEEMKDNVQLTNKLGEENGVSKAKVFEKENRVLARFIVKEDVKEEATKVLVDKYAKELQKAYKDQEINVQAIKDGKVIEEVTVDVKNPTKDKEESNVAKNQTTAQDMNATVINTVPGVFAIKIYLKDAQALKATEKSVLSLEIPGKKSVTLTYNGSHKVFVNANIQGNYTQDELLNSAVIEVKK